MSAALIAQSNHHCFTPGQILQHGPVRSLMQFWCRGGSGRCTVDGEPFDLQVGDLLLMPFDHVVRYQAGRQRPWLVAGLHLLPHCRPPPGVALPFWAVPHQPDHHLATVDWIADADLIDLPRPRRWSLPADHEVILLGEYLASRFIARRVDEGDMRALADMLLTAWRRLLAGEPAHPLPPALERIDRALTEHPQSMPNLQLCVSLAGVSRATLGRLAQRHWGHSVQVHVRTRKLQQACELLRGSDRHISDIAGALGFADPLYFSRVFSQAHGLSPRTWRQRYGGL